MLIFVCELNYVVMWKLGFSGCDGLEGRGCEAKICDQILSGGDPFLLLIPTKILDAVFW